MGTLWSKIYVPANKPPQVSSSSSSGGGYQPLPVVDIAPEAAPAAAATTATAHAHAPALRALDSGLGLEMPVIVVMLVSMLCSVAMIYFGLSTIWDRGAHNVNVVGWLGFAGADMGVNSLYFACMLILMNPKCRSSTMRQGERLVYRDSLYVSHIRLASIMWGISTFTFIGVYLGYYMTYGGEDPWAWPSAYNVERWEKVDVWRGIHQLNTGIRFYAMLDKYYLVFRELAERGRIPADDTRAYKLD
jgi:hypothetical protein